MEDEKKEPLSTMDIAPGKWTTMQLHRAIAFLDSLGDVLKSTLAEDIAVGLKAVVLGRVTVVPNCGTCADIKARYSVICADCATHLGPATPQRMILKLSDGDLTVWGACSFSTIFIPKVWGKDNTIEECEKLLDELDTEEKVEGMIALLSAPKDEYRQ